tara:strand:- start:28 stop:585 length:558 start_codon:yes stop_codon:yes gene_type:complete
MAITRDEERIGPQTNLLISQNNRDKKDWANWRRIRNKSEEQLGQEALDRSINRIPPKTAGDKLYEEGGYLTDPETETDIELEQRNLINSDSMQKLMQVIGGGISTYEALKQFPIKMIQHFLLQGLLGTKALAGEQAQDQLKIGLPPSQTEGHGENLRPGAKRIMMEWREQAREKDKNKEKLKIKK